MLGVAFFEVAVATSLHYSILICTISAIPINLHLPLLLRGHKFCISQMLLGLHPTTRNDFPGTVFPSPHSARIPATARTLLAIPVPTPVPTNAGDPCTVDFNDTFVHSQPVVCGA